MRVLAVPRSTAISFAGSQAIRFIPGNFIDEPLGTWVEKVLGLFPVWKRDLAPLRATASESTCASCGRGQYCDRKELHALDPGDDHLSYPHTPGHLKPLGAEIHKCNHQLATVIAVDRSRRIRQRNSVLQCQPGARPQLAFISIGDRDAE